MDTKSKFTDNTGFEITLTDDKVYVTAVGSQETFALRSVNGIGTYDDIEDYNKQLEENKKKDFTSFKSLGLGLAVFGLILYASSGSVSSAMFCIIPAIIMYVIGKNAKSAEDKSEMKSYFRIMLSGGDRKFQFDKKASNAGDVADFCNKVEDTLTAYNK
jgi:hypothetical protein